MVVRRGNFLQASHNQVSGEVRRKLQGPDDLPVGRQAGKLILMLGFTFFLSIIICCTLCPEMLFEEDEQFKNMKYKYK